MPYRTRAAVRSKRGAARNAHCARCRWPSDGGGSGRIGRVGRIGSRTPPKGRNGHSARVTAHAWPGPLKCTVPAFFAFPALSRPSPPPGRPGGRRRLRSGQWRTRRREGAKEGGGGKEGRCPRPRRGDWSPRTPQRGFAVRAVADATTRSAKRLPLLAHLRRDCGRATASLRIASHASVNAPLTTGHGLLLLALGRMATASVVRFVRSV